MSVNGTSRNASKGRQKMVAQEVRRARYESAHML